MRLIKIGDKIINIDWVIDFEWKEMTGRSNSNQVSIYINLYASRQQGSDTLLVASGDREYMERVWDGLIGLTSMRFDDVETD